MRAKIYAFAMAAALLLLCACGGEKEPVKTVDPYEGMVQVESGFGTKIWVKLYDDVPVSIFDAADFAESGGRVSYTGSEFETRCGIDVSEHQGKIDWEAVAGEGIDFAMIRAGYRGYSQGGLYEDEYFARNIALARQYGIDIGVYFFSQAVTPEEAVEEAEYLLTLLEDAGCRISMPVAFDWEHIGNNDARTDDVGGTTLTDCAVAFCERVRQAGHDPVVYAYRNLAYFVYDLPRLNDYALWMGALGDSPDFYYKHEIWQYSSEGKVKGIDGPVDLNLFFEEKGDGAVPAGENGDARSAPAPDEKQKQAPVPTPDTEDVPAGNVAAAGKETMFTDAVARAYSGTNVEVVATDAPLEDGATLYFLTGGGSYAWPCPSSSHITSMFGYRDHTVIGATKYHSGIDISADDGAEVTAAADGVVTEAGFDSARGNYAVISHSDSEATLYAHMSKLAVSDGDTVSQGDVIGYAGSTGNVTGPHLHFETHVDGVCVDPLQYLADMNFSYAADAGEADFRIMYDK